MRADRTSPDCTCCACVRVCACVCARECLRVRARVCLCAHGCARVHACVCVVLGAYEQLSNRTVDAAVPAEANLEFVPLTALCRAVPESYADEAERSPMRRRLWSEAARRWWSEAARTQCND